MPGGRATGHAGDGLRLGHVHLHVGDIDRGLASYRDVLGFEVWAHLPTARPWSVVHIARRLLEESDGPMLRTGLQGFHGAAITMPRRPEDRPDPARLESRFARFARAAA